jgi:hypothetical protein
VLDLPKESGKGWPLEGQAGMESLVLLARETPLPHDLDLSSILSNLPVQTFQQRDSVVWFKNGEIHPDKTRSLQFFNPQKLNDPVIRTQKLIRERLKKHFQLITAASFANKGK